MKKYLLFLFGMGALCASVLAAPGNGNNGNGNQTAPGQLKKKTDAELLDILREKYARETESKSGREQWHGKVKNQIVDTDNLIKIEIHADGTTFTNAWTTVTPQSSADAQNRRLASLTNNVPARLAAARLARQAEKDQGTVEVVIEQEL